MKEIVKGIRTIYCERILGWEEGLRISSILEPLLDWEVFVVCPKDTCKRIFRAFLQALKCEELKHG
jgi:hypothetical protein